MTSGVWSEALDVPEDHVLRICDIAAAVPLQSGASGVVWNAIMAEVQKFPSKDFNGVVPAKSRSFCNPA